MEKNVTYTLHYDDNGGSGGPGVRTVEGNTDFAIFTTEEITPVRPGYIFSGWSYSPDGEALLHGGDLFSASSTEMTVYAVWAKAGTEAEIVNDAVDENAEPLGVFSSSESNDSQIQIVGDAIGFAFIGAAVILGFIALLLFRQRQPRILSKQEEKDK